MREKSLDKCKVQNATSSDTSDVGASARSASLCRRLIRICSSGSIADGDPLGDP